MHLCSLVLFPFFFPSGARRTIRVDDSHHDVRQQNSTLVNGLEVSAEAREALIPGGSWTLFSRYAAPQPGALRKGSKQDDRRDGQLEPDRAAPWFGSGPHRAKVVLQTASGPDEDPSPPKKVDAKIVKQLREMTGAGMMDCKKALVDAGGNFDTAAEELRKKGLASAEKKASRKASEGIIETYIHTGGKLGVMVEVNCETDFVAKRPEFKELAKAIAMQIAACPTVEVVTAEEIAPELIEREKRIEAQAEDLQGKPEQIVDKIVAGRIAKLIKARILLEQPYIRDPNQSVDEFVKSYVSKLGENIKVARFVRFQMGELQATAHDEE